MTSSDSTRLRAAGPALAGRRAGLLSQAAGPPGARPVKAASRPESLSGPGSVVLRGTERSAVASLPRARRSARPEQAAGLKSVHTRVHTVTQA